ncbi:MAG: outer membrane beta-barrel protein [Prevotellaceae bacterium]|jgi:hypothetical protein|nr:outer membrane beta-barrel protein [Prevotellaceae bacterium]
MKNILLLLNCALLVSLPVFSQEIADSDTVKSTENEIIENEKSSVFVDGKRFNFIFQWEKKSNKKYATESHWAGFGVAVSYLNGLNGVNQGASHYLFLNLLDYTIPLNKHFLFATGLGFDWQKYKFKGNVSLKNDDNGITCFIYDNSKNYVSSKFNIYHMTIPFVAEYQTGSKKFDDFFIHAGVEVLIKTTSKSEARIKTEDGKIKKEKYIGLNTRALNARFILRTGVNNFSILGYYQPFSIFKNDLGIGINPYGIGIMIDF